MPSASYHCSHRLTEPRSLPPRERDPYEILSRLELQHLLQVFQRYALSLYAAALAYLALDWTRPQRVFDLSLPGPTRRRLRFPRAFAGMTRAGQFERPIRRRDEHGQILAHALARAIAPCLLEGSRGQYESLAGGFRSGARKSAISAWAHVSGAFVAAHA
jgi:hypothetical protein